MSLRKDMFYSSSTRAENLVKHREMGLGTGLGTGKGTGKELVRNWDGELGTGETQGLKAKRVRNWKNAVIWKQEVRSSVI